RDELERLQQIADTYNCMPIMEAMAGDAVLARQTAEQGFAVAQQIGPSPQLVRACVNYAFTLGLSQERQLVWEYGERAGAVAKELGDPQLIAKCTVYYGMGEAYAGAERDCERRLTGNFEQYGRWLDADAFNMTCGILSSGFAIRGYAREAVEWLERLIAKLK